MAITSLIWYATAAQASFPSTVIHWLDMRSSGRAHCNSHACRFSGRLAFAIGSFVQTRAASRLPPLRQGLQMPKQLAPIVLVAAPVAAASGLSAHRRAGHAA